MRFLLTVVFCFLMTICSSQSSPIVQRAKIWYSNADDLSRLEALGIPTDHGIKKNNFYFISEFYKDNLERAKADGFKIDILIPDVIAHFLEQNCLNKSSYKLSSCDGDLGNNYPTPSNFNQGSMGGYLTYQEVLNELNDMHAQYPNLISAPQDISNFTTQGQTNNSVTPSIGGNGIKWVRISDNPNVDENEPELLYTSIHHAREPMSLMQNIYYMWYLLENYDTQDDIKGIVDNTELYFVPVVNPDGYLHNEFTNPNGGGFWRKNRFNGNGVDNNRNYNYFINGNSSNGVWGGTGSSGNPNSQIYRGSSPISEVENQAIKWFVEQHNFVIALNSHTFGELLYFPFAYNGQATPDEALFTAMGGELTSRNNYFSLRDCCFSGDSDDFMYGTVGTHNSILAFTPEVGTAFWMPAADIDRVCKDMMYQNVTAAHMANGYGRLHETASLFTGDQAQSVASFEIKNFGVQSSGNFTVSLNPVSSNITSVGSVATFNNLGLLQLATGTVNYQVDPTTNFGDPVIYDLVVNNGLYNISQRVEKIYGAKTQVFLDAGNSNITNFAANNWGVTTSVFVSPNASLTDSPNGNYANNQTKAITLDNSIDLNGVIGASATFKARWNIEANFDYVAFEISTDNGATWTPQCGEFTTTGTANQDNGMPIYDGVQNDWVQETINLNAYLGKSILARFLLVTDNGVTADGFYFDDLEFDILNAQNLGLNTVTQNVFNVFPNPVENLLHINATLSNFEVTVYNTLGQQLEHNSYQNPEVAINTEPWSSGIYFVTVKSENHSAVFKVIKE